MDVDAVKEVFWQRLAQRCARMFAPVDLDPLGVPGVLQARQLLRVAQQRRCNKSACVNRCLRDIITSTMSEAFAVKSGDLWKITLHNDMLSNEITGKR